MKIAKYLSEFKSPSLFLPRSIYIVLRRKILVLNETIWEYTELVCNYSLINNLYARKLTHSVH